MLQRIPHLDHFVSLLVLCPFFLLLGSCQPKKQQEPAPNNKNTIVPENPTRNGKLVVALESNSTDYFLYRGEPMGFHLDLLEDFARHVHKELVIIPGENLVQQLKDLREQEVDIVASNLNVSKRRKRMFTFSHPLYQTPQVLVQRKRRYLEDTLAYVETPQQLAGRSVHVIKYSSFEENLRTLNRDIRNAPPIQIIPENRMEEELMLDVDSGYILYTVASANKALHFAKEHPRLDASLAIGPPQAVAWALNKHSDSLLEQVNHWIDSLAGTPTLSYLYHKYYELPLHLTVRSVEAGFRKMDSISDFRRTQQRNFWISEGVLDAEDSSFFQKPVHRIRRPRSTGFVPSRQISPFDKLLQKYSPDIPWDWRLLASLIYQESQFNPQAVSKRGAIGLMQMMPATAKQYKLDLRSSEEAQIRAGVKFIKSIYKALPDSIPEDEQVYFALASYNIGLGHVLDARRLARKYGADPNIWYGNVETYMMLKSNPRYYRDPASRNGYARGREAVEFVREIDERYMHYVNLSE